MASTEEPEYYWMSHYKLFMDTCTNPDLEPINVFPPLSSKQVEELLLIRELSVELQKKKDEEIRKAAEAAETVKVEEEEPSAENVEENPEEEKKDTSSATE